MKGTHVYLWPIHIDVWQKPSQYYKVIILQFKKERENPPEQEDYAPQLESSPCSLQLEEAPVQQQRPRAAINKQQQKGNCVKQQRG